MNKNASEEEFFGSIFLMRLFAFPFAEEKAGESFVRVGLFLYDIVDSFGDRKLRAVFFAEHEQRVGGGDAFGEFFGRQAAHEILAESPVVAVRGK